MYVIAVNNKKIRNFSEGRAWLRFGKIHGEKYASQNIHHDKACKIMHIFPDNIDDAICVARSECIK